MCEIAIKTSEYGDLEYVPEEFRSEELMGTSQALCEKN
jgi:hypothetical protein